MKNLDEKINNYWGEMPYRRNRSDSEYQKKLIKKYGSKIMKEYKELCMKDDGENIELTEFIYSTGLHEDAVPETTLMYRENLKMLITYLENQDSFKMIDLGCGAGKTTIGLALFLNNLTSIAGIERSNSALREFKKNIKNTEKRYSKNIGKKIIMLKGDYSCNKTIESLKGFNADKAVINYGPYDTSEVAQIINSLKSKDAIKEDSETIIVHNHVPRKIPFNDEFEDEHNMHIINADINHSSKWLGIQYELLDYKKILPELAVVVGRLK